MRLHTDDCMSVCTVHVCMLNNTCVLSNSRGRRHSHAFKSNQTKTKVKWNEICKFSAKRYKLFTLLQQCNFVHNNFHRQPYTAIWQQWLPLTPCYLQLNKPENYVDITRFNANANAIYNVMRMCTQTRFPMFRNQ